MVKPIMSFGQLLKQAGIKIKSCNLLDEFADNSVKAKWFNIVLNDGTKGTYEVVKEGKRLRQKVELDKKVVEYFTRKDGIYTQDLFSRKINDYVEIPQTLSQGYVKDNHRITQAISYKKTPVGVKAKINNGKVSNEIRTLQELHTNKLLGEHSVIPQDILIAGDGSYLEIFQRVPHALEKGHTILKDIFRQYGSF